MRKELKVKPYVYPEPVLIIGTYDKEGVPNAMNAAWGGISDDYQVSMCLSAHHKTVKNVEELKAFTVSMGTKSQVVACDYVGIASGNDTKDKIAKTGWHVTKSDKVNAPIFEELPLALECELVSYNPDTCILTGEIVGVSVDESILTDEKIDIDKLEPISYDPASQKYVLVKGFVGNAFKEGLKLK